MSRGLASLTRRRFGTPRSAAVVIVALTLLAAFLVAAAPRALVGVVRDEVSFQVSQLSAPARDMTAKVLNAPVIFGAGESPRTAWPEGADANFGALADRLALIREGFTAPVRDVTAEAEFTVYIETPLTAEPDPFPADLPIPRVQLQADPAMTEHLRLVDGDWPAPRADEAAAISLLLSQEAAERLAWEVGETRILSDGRAAVLSGIAAAVDPAADRWSHLPETLSATFYDDGNRRPTMTSAAYVDPGSWGQVADMGMPVQLLAWYPVSAAAVVSLEPEALLTGLREATSQSLSIDDLGTRARFTTDVTDATATSLARSHSTNATLAVAAVGPLAVAIALIVLAASLVIRRRRTDLTLLSARGTSLARLRGLVAWEGLILGLPAAVAATAAAVAVTSFDAGILPTLLAVSVGLVPALALAASIRAAMLAGARTDLDTASQGRLARVVRLLVVVLAVLAVGMLVFRGVGRASAGVDPLVVAAPLLATVALGMLAVALHPKWLSAVLRVMQRGRGVVGLVGAARSLRDPAAGTTAVLAMLVAIAIAVFSSLVLATVDRGGAAAAERAVGADVKLSGPFFDEDVIAQIRTTPGVADAVGVLVADRVTVEGAEGSLVAPLVITDPARLAAVQSGLSEPFPGRSMTAGRDPIDAVAGAELVAATGGGDVETPIGAARIVAAPAQLAGAGLGAGFLVVDAVDYMAATGQGVFPRVVLVDVEDGADAAEVATAVSVLVGSPHAVERLDMRTAAIQASPAVSALRGALLAALALAVVLSVVAVLLVAGVTRDARSRVIALLRTMGLDRRQARGIVAWEFGPLGVSALIGGLALGVALPLLVLSSVDLRPFTAGLTQPPLTIDPALTGGLVLVVAVSLALAVVGGILTARTTSLVTVLRTEEDR